MGLSIDRDKVIKGLKCLITDDVPCDGCPYNGCGYCIKSIASDALSLLEEQQKEIENLKQTSQSMMEGVCLLKEQEAVILTNMVHSKHGLGRSVKLK